MNSLLAVQRRFYSALRGEADISAETGPGAMERLAVHRGTIDAGLTQTLENAFPASRRILGAEAFTVLAADFISAHPPCHPLLSTFGRDFSAFAAKHAIARAHPHLNDLARLEWARQEAYVAADAPVLDPSAINAHDADALSSLRLQLHPSTRLITSRFPVHRIWRRALADDASDSRFDGEETAEDVIVTRPRHEVTTRLLGAGEAALVRAIAGGAALGAAVTAALAASRDFEATAALAGHFAHGTFLSL